MMRIEGGGGGGVEQMRTSSSNHRVDLHKVIMKKKRCCSYYSKKRIRLRRPLETSTTLQQLFDSCKYAFNAPQTLPSPAHIQNLCYILDGMKAEDVGLSRDLQFFKPDSEIEGPPRVTSATIYKCPNFELCIFFLPATAVIPLHNHPEMTVFSKLLLGTMHIKAYDWVEDSSTNSKPGRKAKLKANTTFTAPCDTRVLYPTSGGNIHEFRAITPCAVLDVIGPPYSKDDGRECSYYNEIPSHTFLDKEEITKVKEDLGSCYRWLEEIEIPRESEMDGIEYMGPPINNSTS
ncbi:hypothetical protein ACS0TY_026497 [Phlomoides rotata]